MLSRKKRLQTPTFLEGTHGTYLRRDSPPPLPSLSGTVVPSRNTATDNVLPSCNSSQALSSNGGEKRHLALSSHSFTHQRRMTEQPRRLLVASQSIGNVVPCGATPDLRQASVSLQTLSVKQFWSSIIGSENVVCDQDAEEELPLPNNWDIELTSDGIRYYVDHNTRRTHWLHPLARESLPDGWQKLFDPHHGVIYFNEAERRSQLDHPGIATPTSPPTQGVSPQTTASANNRTPTSKTNNRKAESTIENLNIIQDGEAPEWLRMYSKADPSLDHLLEWELFSEEQLQHYSELMLKLHKQEVINVVIRYERMRKAFLRELERRDEMNENDNGF